MNATADAAVCAAGCGRPRRYRSWCNTHYKRWLVHGDPGPAAIRTKRYDGPCSVERCDTPARNAGLCKMHAARVKRHGYAGEADKQHAVSYDGVPCEVEDCNRRPKSRGLCHPHYRRWLRWGDPLGSRPVVPAVDRFRSRVVVGPPPETRPGLGPCHLWTAGKTKQGHRYTPENTYRAPEGGISCRTCARNRDRARSRPNRKAA